MELPDINNDYWLFADSLKTEGNIFEFVEYIPNYKTKNNKEIPVFVLLGADDKGNIGDFKLALFNIFNYKEVKKFLADKSGAIKLRVLPHLDATSKPSGKLIMQLA